MNTLSQSIEELFDSKEPITLGQFLSSTKQQSYGFILLLLALPAALPVPAPGYASPFGLILTLLGLQMVAGKNSPWCPKWACNKKLPITKGSKLLSSITSFLKFFEMFLKPRIKFVTRGVGYRVLGVITALCGLSMIIPLPLTNTIPAFSIFLIGLSFLEDDGLFALFGIISSMIGIAISGTLVFLFFQLGLEAVDVVKDFLKSLI